MGFSVVRGELVDDQETVDIRIDDADLSFLSFRVDLSDQLECDTHEKREELFEYLLWVGLGVNPTVLLRPDDSLLGLASPLFHLGDPLQAAR